MFILSKMYLDLKNSTHDTFLFYWVNLSWLYLSYFIIVVEVSFGILSYAFMIYLFCFLVLFCFYKGRLFLGMGCGFLLSHIHKKAASMIRHREKQKLHVIV